MDWLSGFGGFRIRTLFLSIIVVYLLVRQAKISEKEKRGIWLSGLVFLVLRLIFEGVARTQGLWEYSVKSFSLAGLPLDIFVAMAIFFGSGAAFIQHYLTGKSKSQLILGQLALALLVTLYDYWGASFYRYFQFGTGGYLTKLLLFWLLTLASGSFYAWYRGLGNKEV